MANPVPDNHSRKDQHGAPKDVAIDPQQRLPVAPVIDDQQGLQSLTLPPVNEDRSLEGVLEQAARAFEGDRVEAGKLGAVDRADRQVESFFKPERGTSKSPAFLSVWANRFPTELFLQDGVKPSAECQTLMDRCLEVARSFKDREALYSPDNKISPELERAVGEHAYWGMLIPEEHGGQAAPFETFTKFLFEMAKVDSTLAGLASIHGCIGAVDPLCTFGNEEQKQRYLPRLASGELLSAFALTEPGAGSDLTAVQTTATLEGDHYVINGRKLFISNARLGGSIGLVCLVNGKPATILVDLPSAEDATFRFESYGIYALPHLWNRGMVFNGFRVPKDNLLDATMGNTVRGDGITIAYHGLNRGRVALCANAGGTLAALLANRVPWAKERFTYNKAIGERQLVEERFGKAAAYIVGCEAISTWCAKLLDAGYRGELECIVAKIFGSDALQEISINCILKTYGGRSFLKGSAEGDNLHDLIAPSIYEGDNDMLSMAMVKGLINDHAKKFVAPIAAKVIELKESGRLRGDFEPANAYPSELWQLRKQFAPLVGWIVRHAARRAMEKIFGRPTEVPADMPKELRKHLLFASAKLATIPSRIDWLMLKYGPKLQDEQCALRDLSRDVQTMLMIAVVSCWGSNQEDKVLRQAADVLCQDLTRKITNGRMSTRLSKGFARLGRAVIAGGFAHTRDLPAEPIQQQYAGLGKRD